MLKCNDIISEEKIDIYYSMITLKFLFLFIIIIIFIFLNIILFNYLYFFNFYNSL